MKAKPAFWGLGAMAAIVAVIAVGTAPTDAQVVERSNPNVDRPLHREGDRAVNETRHDAAHAHNTCKASELIGMNVRGLNGEDNIGSISDLVIDHSGRVKYAAVSFGGFLGMGDKLFAVPFESIDFVKTDDDAYARIDVTEETLKEKKGFNQDEWPTDADRSFSSVNLRRQATMPSVSR
jgi:sporulation protein YlmC with PRC-barrel domain